MNLRIAAVLAVLTAGLTAGCAASVAGEAHIASGPASGSVTTGDAPSASADDRSVGPSSVLTIPGLSKDCTTVVAAITAFSSVLQGVESGNGVVTQGNVDEALAALPATGLPDRPQADVKVLRTVVTGAAGKTLMDVGLSMADGKVVAALKDLTSWAQANCG